MADKDELGRRLSIGDELSDKHYPKSKADPFKVTSLSTPFYNCVAWAVRETEVWMQPPPHEGHAIQYAWPSDIKISQKLEAYVELFEKKYGFEKCECGDLEKGYEKIALFHARNFGIHVSRQLSDGMWTSKMGNGPDVSHAIQSYIGGKFDRVAQYLRRAGKNADNKFPGMPYSKVSRPKK